MSKRLTDTDKWKDSWFLDLTVEAKTLFCFLCDYCDIAGFYERHDRTASFFTGIPVDRFQELYKQLEKSVCERDGLIWVRNFIKHQKNLPLNPLNSAHFGILTLLNHKSSKFGDLYESCLGLSVEKIRGLLGAIKPLSRGTGKGIGIGKGIGKGKKEKKEVVGEGGENNFSDFIKSLKSNIAYKGIDIDRELGKMDAWLLTPRGRGRKKTKRFIVNWLNKCDAMVGDPYESPSERIKRLARGTK